MERMWREVDVHLEGSVWVFRGSLVRTANRWMFGGLERYLGIVGASTLKSGDLMTWNGRSMVGSRAWSCRGAVSMEHAVV